MEAAAALSSPEQRKQFCLWEGVSSGELRRYAEAVKENDQRLKPKQLLVERVTADEPAAKKRRPMSARRLSGGGAAPPQLLQRESLPLPHGGR